MATIDSFRVAVEQGEVDDLRRRLLATRWPDEVTGAAWDYGVPLAWLREMTDYWTHQFDWRAQEEIINVLPNYRAVLDGFHLHYIRLTPASGVGIPLLLLHGWPSSFVEYLKIIPLLAEVGFEVIVPSLPGYGFSDIPVERGFTSESIAEVVLKLMDALGIERFGVHAHDHGASVMSRLAYRHPERIIGYHTTEPGIPGPVIDRESSDRTEAERAFFAFARDWQPRDNGYARIQSTRPQTLAYAMEDSPVGLAAWLLDKWQVWTAPPSGDLLDSFTRDELLCNVAVYWFTRTANAGARAYFENVHYLEALPPEATIDVPVGVTLVATQGIERAPREYAAIRYPDIRYWHELPRGGHFIAGEEPELLAESITAFFREIS
jgi:pimeloyl-ACP methyl ester carboxylesterase